MPPGMPVLFVHGVPDTHRVWSALPGRIARPDLVTLSLPGFGCPRPDGFDATKEEELGRFWAPARAGRG
jgi:pimeloyl-ACP methyl ester carboxylesterase